MMSLISSKVMMNKFQKLTLLSRIFIIFESVLIHRRTHKLCMPIDSDPETNYLHTKIKITL